MPVVWPCQRLAQKGFWKRSKPCSNCNSNWCSHRNKKYLLINQPFIYGFHGSTWHFTTFLLLFKRKNEMRGKRRRRDRQAGKEPHDARKGIWRKWMKEKCEQFLQTEESAPLSRNECLVLVWNLWGGLGVWILQQMLLLYLGNDGISSCLLGNDLSHQQKVSKDTFGTSPVKWEAKLWPDMLHSHG
jgi:hypothetical protein